MDLVGPFYRRVPRILIVDDNRDNAYLLKELLSRHDYEIATSNNAEEAAQEIRANPPDLILLDVVMPGRSGYELCQELKSSPETRLIPVVLITGLTDREDKIHGIEVGADDFLNKPIFPEELFARVKSLLKLKEFTDELENVEDVLDTLALSVEARDPYTAGHCERLAGYAVQLGTALNLGQEDLTALRRGGYLHDIGKITVPDEILKKGSNLTPAEWQVMRQHPVAGENICRPLKSLRPILPIIRQHHEHWNGSGYPDHLAGEEIALLARILQVVDVYDALRTARPYKPALSHAQAVKTMQEETHRGLWDAELVDTFLRLVDRQKAA